MKQEKIFDYLIEQEKTDPDFHFYRGSNGGLAISYPGYKNMKLFAIREVLQKEFGLKFDFNKGTEKYDPVCGKTFVYFKNVYKMETI